MRIFDIEISQIAVANFLDLVISKAKTKEKYLIGHANIRGLNFAYSDSTFKAFYKKCDFITVDGFGVLLGARVLGQKVDPKSRFTCPDYLEQLLAMLAEEKIRIFFLAGEESMLAKLDSKLTSSHPMLEFEIHHGYFDKDGNENELIISKINDFKPNILYVGFGMPHQEKWILNNYDNLSNCLILPLGACLDFYTGHTYRGPKFLTNTGFEWLVRLLTEPRRLWKRYIIGNPLFFIRIFKERIFS